MKKALFVIVSIVLLVVFVTVFSRDDYSEEVATIEEELLLLQEISYEVEWNTEGSQLFGDTLRIETSVGYEVELTTANLQSISFELFACEQSNVRPLPWITPKAAAGHGSEDVNPAKVAGLKQVNLLQIVNREFTASIDHGEYCLFHQVFGPIESEGIPMLHFVGHYRLLSSGDWQQFEIKSDSAYGENIPFNKSISQGSVVSIVYSVATMLDGIEFENRSDSKLVAREIINNLITDAKVSVEPR